MYKRTFEVKETTVYRKLYETASWYTDVEVQAGEYPVTFYTSNGREVDPDVVRPYWAVVRMPGIVVSDLFIDRLFTSSKVRKDEGVGKPFVYGLQLSADSFREG